MGETEARLKTRDWRVLLRQAEAQDAGEDGQYGVERRGGRAAHPSWAGASSACR